MHRILDTDALALANSSTQVSDEIENMENDEKWRKHLLSALTISSRVKPVYRYKTVCLLKKSK